MKSLLYASHAVQKFSDDALIELLRKSRANNVRDGLTGMLLYRGGNFLQVLEGDPDMVARTYDRIDADPRHDGVTMLITETIAERRFGDWTMGFHNLDKVAEADMPGVSNFLTQRFDISQFQQSPQRIYSFLLSFKEMMR